MSPPKPRSSGLRARRSPGLSSRVGRDRLPVERHDRSQVDDGDADAVLLGLLCRDERPLHQRAPREDHEVGRPRARPRPCRTESCSRVPGTAPCCRSGGRDACARGTSPGRRIGSPCAAGRPHPRAFDGNTMRMPGTVREDRDAGLAVVRRAAAQVAADRDADDHRAAPVVVRPIAHHRHLVAHLHDSRARCSRRTGFRRPASSRAAPCRRARPMMFASASGELNTRSLPYSCLQSVRHLEDAAFAGHLRERRSHGWRRPRPGRRRRRAGRAPSRREASRLIAATIVSGDPAGVGSVANAGDVGIDRQERKRSGMRSRVPASERRAPVPPPR